MTTAMSDAPDRGVVARSSTSSRGGGRREEEKDLYVENPKMERFTSNQYRQPTQTVTLKDRYEVIEWMLAEEKKGKTRKPYEIYFRAIDEFPLCFQGKDKANKEKARYWWKERHREDLALLALTNPDSTSRDPTIPGRSEEAQRCFTALKQRLYEAVFREGIDDEEELKTIGMGIMYRYPTAAKANRMRHVKLYMSKFLKEKECRKLLQEKRKEENGNSMDTTEDGNGKVKAGRKKEATENETRGGKAGDSKMNDKMTTENGNVAEAEEQEGDTTENGNVAESEEVGNTTDNGDVAEAKEKEGNTTENGIGEGLKEREDGNGTETGIGEESQQKEDGNTNNKNVDIEMSDEKSVQEEGVKVRSTIKKKKKSKKKKRRSKDTRANGNGEEETKETEENENSEKDKGIVDKIEEGALKIRSMIKKKRKKKKKDILGIGGKSAKSKALEKASLKELVKGTTKNNNGTSRMARNINANAS